MSPNPLPFIVSGFVLFGLTAVAERYHSSQFKKHTDRLEAAETPAEIDRELRRFHNDDSIDHAILALELGHYGGTLLMMVGVALVVLE